MWACTRWGGAATPPLVLAIVTIFGWRWAFVAFALLGVIWCAIFFVWFRNDPAEHPSVNITELQLIETSRNLQNHQAASRKWLTVLMTPQVAILVLQYFCFSFVWYFYVTWLPTYLREARSQAPGRAAALSVLPLLFGGFGSLLSGLLPIRIPRRRIALFGFLGAAILLFAFSRTQAVVPAMLCMGMASFCQRPDHANLMERLRRDRWFLYRNSGRHDEYARKSGRIRALQWIGGFILQRTGGNWNPLIYLMVGASIISAVCWLFLGSKSTRPGLAGALGSVANNCRLFRRVGIENLYTIMAYNSSF